MRPFEHDFFQIAVAQSRAKVPADAQKNEVGLEVTPFEWVLIYHSGPSLACFHPLYQINFFLAELAPFL